MHETVGIVCRFFRTESLRRCPSPKTETCFCLSAILIQSAQAFFHVAKRYPTNSTKRFPATRRCPSLPGRNPARQPSRRFLESDFPAVALRQKRLHPFLSV